MLCNEEILWKTLSIFIQSKLFAHESESITLYLVSLQLRNFQHSRNKANFSLNYDHFFLSPHTSEKPNFQAERDLNVQNILCGFCVLIFQRTPYRLEETLLLSNSIDSNRSKKELRAEEDSQVMTGKLAHKTLSFLGC